MPEKITIDELTRRIADPTYPESELARYFVSDEARSGPFDPTLAFNPATVEIPLDPQARARGDVALAGANNWARLRRRWAFEARISGGYEGPIVVSEGDSWFQYPLLLEDVIDHLMTDFAVRSLDAAGDTLQNMFDTGEYLPAIQETRASVFLFSGGGNDVLGGGNLKEHLRDFDEALTPADHILPSYGEILDHAIALYDRIFRSVEDAPGDILTICHGYDHVIPNEGRWLGRPMIERGITNRAFQKKITDAMVDRFNARLKRLADAFPRVTYLDLRGVVGPDETRWNDELHPTNAGYADVARRFKRAIQQASSRSLEEVAASRRVFRTTGSLQRALAGETAAPAERAIVDELVAPAIPRRGRTGLSLHIGLNTIDPNHYGNDGALVACEFDAEAMEEIARANGFEVMARHSSPKGTRADLLDGIGQAAKTLKGGDIFLLTYAGHGARVPDFNRDEEEGLDEALCLYDAMLIDDELYEAWRAFADDVRVLMVSDSCHSRSQIRQAAAAALEPVQPGGPAPRMLPQAVAGRAIRNNRPFYQNIFTGTRSLNEGALVKELSFPLRCSVMLLSGCQDEQVSLDGAMNGRFTQELLTVWREAQFEGDYRAFIKAIRSGMPDTQLPDLFTVGRPNPAFLGQKPFSI